MLDNMIEKIVILYGIHSTWVILSVCHIMSHFSVSLANLGHIFEVYNMMLYSLKSLKNLLFNIENLKKFLPSGRFIHIFS